MKIPNVISAIVLFIILFVSCNRESKFPVVDFTFTNYLEGPAYIEFTNNTVMAEEYLWDFGDGNLSREVNPKNLYHLPGEYKVKLKATNAYGSTIKEDVVTIYGTTFQIKNSCTDMVHGVLAEYSDGGILYSYFFGPLKRGQYTAFEYVNTTELWLSFQKADGRIFVVTTPFTIIGNKNNTLNIHDYLPGYYE
jgi:PKD repeat protein